MDPLKISAQFAAFVWYTNQSTQTPVPDPQGWAYARQAWRSFVPLAHEGMGRLLIAMAQGRSRKKGAKRRAPAMAVAG